jgi:hypothetical protein
MIASARVTAYRVFRSRPYVTSVMPVLAHLWQVLRLHRNDPPAVHLDKLEQGVQAKRCALIGRVGVVQSPGRGVSAPHQYCPDGIRGGKAPGPGA